MINRYLLTDEIIKKYTRINCRKYILFNLIVELIFLLVCIGFYFYFDSIRFLHLSCFFFLMLFLTFYRVHKAIKVEVERIHIRYGDEPQYMNIGIIITVKDNTMSIPYDKIIKYTKTDDFIMVRIKAKMVVVLKKDSFVEGTYDDCIALLNDICK